MNGKSVQDIERKLKPELIFNKNRPYRHAAREIVRKNV
jgi:hypothetical protein